MSDFDFDAYLDTKLKNVDFKTKYESVLGSSEEKTARLAAMKAEQAAQEKSWAGRAGYTADDFVGARINDAASFVSGASRLVGHVTSLVPNALSMLQTAGNTSADYEAQRRAAQGKPLLSSEKRAVENFARANELRKDARAVNNFFDLTGIVDQTNRNQLNTDLTQGVDAKWDETKQAWNDGHIGQAVAGLGSILLQAGDAVISNPAAAREYIIENAPQIFVGAAGVPGAAVMAASNVGYAADEYQKGIENYMAQNNGALPPDDMRHRMALQAASLAVAEHAGDHAIVAASKAKRVLGGAAGAAADEAATLGFKQSLKNIGVAGLESGATEAATEGYQTWAENEIEGKDTNFSDILAGAVIGGVAGAGNSAGMRTLAEATKSTPEHVEQRVQEAAKQVEEAKVVQAAVEEKDPSKFLDEKSKDYSPAKAIAVMQTLATQEGTTEDEFKGHLKAASEVIDRLEAKRETLDPEAVRKEITDLQEELKTADPDEHEDIQSLIDANTERLNDLTGPKTKTSYDNQRKKLDMQIKEAEAAYAGFTRDAVPSPAVAEVRDHIQKADDTDPEVASTAGDALINLSMTAPHDVPADAVQKLVENDKNGLAPEQRDFLRKFSEARVAENVLKKLGDVSKEVLFGSPRYVGISQYRDRISQAIKSDNQGRAERQLAQLNAFVQDHTAKLHMAESVPNGTQVVKNTQTKQWEINTGRRLSDKALKENGGFNIHHNSDKLIEGIQKEVTALSLAHAQLSKAVGLRFGTPAVQSISSPANTTPTSSSLSREKGEREVHLESGVADAPPASTQSVAPTPQNAAPEKKKLALSGEERQARIDAILMAAKANPNNGGQPRVVSRSESAPVALPMDNTTTEDPHYARALDRALQLPEIGPKDLQDHLNIGYNRAMRLIERMEADHVVTRSVAGKSYVVNTASPSATSPVAAKAAPATASAAANAGEVEAANKPAENAGFSNENEPAATPLNTAPEATEHQAEAQAEAQGAEVATAEVPVTDNNPVIEQGRLSHMAGFQEKPTQTVAQMYADPAFNPVSQFVNQKSTNETYKTVRPLVRIKDFVTKVMTGYVDQFTNLIGHEPDSTEITALDHFFKKVQGWNKVILSNIGTFPDTEAKFEFRFEDMMQFFVDRSGGDIKVDENLLSAISYGAYHWAVDTASAPRMSNEKINAMFGRDKDAWVDGDIWKHIKGMHGHEDVTINDIGASVMQSLGFSLRPNAPQDILPRIQSALGAHALLVLAKEGLIQRKAIYRSDIVSNLEPLRGDMNPEGKLLMFIFPNYDKLEAFREVNKGTGNVVDKLMTAEPGTQFATTEPVKFTQQYAQHTRQEISPLQRKALERLHKTPHTVIPEMFKALKGLGVEAILRIAGAVDVEQDHVHAINVESVEAQNRNLRTQIDLMLEMLGVTDPASLTDDQINALAKTQYFVQGEVWKNFRAGIATRSLNQQTSKIHRYMFGRPNWTATIDLANTEQHNDLLIAFAAGLGMKTDEQPNAQTLELFQQEIAKPKVRAAIDAMKAGLFQNDWSNADAVTEFAADKEGMMTLQTLAMLAKYENAGGKGKLDVTMLVGADGKTNGPILTHLALGAAADTDSLLKMMERGGMFRHGEEQPTHYSESRANGLKDLYEDLASKLLSNIKDSPQMDAMQVITGKLKDGESVTKHGRNLVKTPLTAFAFGSAMQGSILAMENKFIASIYEKIEGLSRDEAAADTDEKRATVEANKVAFIRAVNTLLKHGNPRAELTGEDISIKALMLHPLEEKDEEALRHAFQKLMGSTIKNQFGGTSTVGPVPETMESYFATFIQRRTDLNTTIGAAYTIYAEAYKAARTAMVEKLMDEGKIAYRVGRTGAMEGKKIPLHDLTAEQEAELRAQVKDLLPVANTAYTVDDNNLAAGLYMAKQDAGLSDDPLHASKINVAVKIRQPGTGAKAIGNVLRVASMVRTEVDPGVAGTPYFIHSLDSANMHMALLDADQSMNVHDEIGNSPVMISKAAGAINKATVQNLLKFSPAREALNMMERMIIATAKGIENGTITQDTVARIVSSWADTAKRQYKMRNAPDARTAARLIVGMALDNAVRADTLRLNTIAQLGAVDQYVWEGGQFTELADIRAEAEQRLKDLNRKMNPDAAKAMTTILDFYNGKEVAVESKETLDAVPEASAQVSGAMASQVAGKPVTQELVNQMDPAKRAETIQKVAEAQAAAPGTGWTPFGLLGVPTKIDAPIRDAFNAKPTMNRHEVVQLLAKNLSQGYRQILEVTAKALPSNLQVVMVTKDSDPAIITKAEQENSRGWFVPTKDGGNTVYVLSDEFVHSGLSAETLLHELVHAGTARELIHPTSKASKSLQTDLKNLLEHLKQQEGAAKFGHILNGENALHELIAWGMSNREFQAWMSKIPFQSKTTRNRLANAFKEFVRILTGGRYKDTALETLLRNTAGIYAQAMENQSGVEANLSQVAAPESYTTAELYEALASDANPLSEQDDARIRAVMIKLVEKLAPVYGVFGKEVQTKNLTAESIFAAAAAPGGIAPFASDVLAHGFAMNDQVAFVLEQVEAVTRAALSDEAHTSMAYRELAKLHAEAAQALKGKLDADLYDFLFKLEAGNDNRSNYLSRFVALGLVHPEVNKALQFQTKVETPAMATSFSERIAMIWDQILEWVTGKWTQTHAGQRADNKLDTLATQLAKIESTRRARLNTNKGATAAALEETFRGVATKARDKAGEFLESDFFKKSKNGFMNAAGSIGSLAVKDQLDRLMLAYQSFSDLHFKGDQGMFSGILNELQGAKEDSKVFWKLSRITKYLEGQRKDLISMTTKVALQAFANKGKDLTKEAKKAMSAVMLRTDMSSLLDQYGMDGILDMLKDKAKLASALSKTEQELAGNKHLLFYLNAAEALGYQMATGDAGIEHTLLNTYAIARLHGTDMMAQVTEETAAKVEPILDRLASLYALSYSSAPDVTETIKVFEAEATRDDKQNGAELVLRLHQNLQKESKDRLFKEQQALMMKGYVPEIYNHHIEVITATAEKEQDMRKLGYGKGMELSKDDADPEKGEKRLYARWGVGLLPYVSGSLSMTAMNTKGSTKHNGNMDLFTEQGQYNSDMMHHIQSQKAAAIKDMFRKRVHPGQSNQSYMVPVLNPSGHVVNYRYMMKNRVKDTVMQRDNRFERLLGVMAGSIYDKQESPKQNATIVQALKAQYDLEFKTRAMSYVEIGPRAPDPANRERYRMLPEATKQAIRETWKSDSMFVRSDLLDLHFGYRKRSLSEVFKQDRAAREGLSKYVAEILGFAAGGRLNINATDEEARVRDDRAAIRVRSVEEIWQTFVREAKDMIVIKSGSTLMGNIVSNFSLLYAYGVPVMDMLRNHRVALRGAVSYNKDSEELFKLQTAVDTGTAGDVSAAKLRIAKLKDQMARNPVRELIEAGLMPTIVEDVEVDDDIYSFKSRFIQKVEEKTGELNPHVLSVGKSLYMAHDTMLYKFMSQGASMSDFLARYTLYQHMTTKKNPMSKADAIQLASDAFINYDVPTHRNLQYANDMGMVRFTKYYLRIQKVILHLYKEQPARMLSLMAMHHYFPAVSTVLDSAFLSRLTHNPLSWGAFEYAFSFDDLLSSKAIGLPFK